MHQFSFYDDLRRSPTASFRSVEEQPKPSSGRALHIATDSRALPGQSITLCHIPIFLRYTMKNKKGYDDVADLSYGGTAGALLAMHHFNNGDGSIVEDLQGINQTCKIRLTSEVVDTQSSQIVAVQSLADMITNRKGSDILQPQPCAIMGAAWYDISQSMATVTGVYDLLQVSPSSSSMSLDSVSNYPLFSRTHPSDEAKGQLAVKYFDKVLHIKYFGVLFIDNEQGIALQKTVLDAAAKLDMKARSVSFRANSVDSLRNSLFQLKEFGFNYFLGIIFPLEYDYVMELAAEVGIAGPGKFWLTTGHLADAFAGGNTTIETGSNASMGSTGIGILHDDGEYGLPQYEKFLTQWRKLENNQEALDYINSKQPQPPEGSNIKFERQGGYFRKRPSHYATFSYDAIAGMGIAACRAASKSTLPDDYFSGKQHHEAFTNHSFIGATDNVSFAGDSFSRDGDSVNYFVSEVHEVDRDKAAGTSVFSGTTKVYFDTSSRVWKSFQGREFIYSGGTSTPPPELPPHSLETHNLTIPLRTICLLLAGTAMLTSLGLSVVVFLKRKNRVIVSSQPPFLYMLCMGTFIMSSAIIPLTIDDAFGGSDDGVSMACNARIWLFSLGFTMTFAALYSKTWRINKLVSSSNRLRRVELKAKDVTVPFLILFLSNVVILTLWTILAPLTWEREILQYDQFGRELESVGSCSSEGSLPFIIALLLVNGTALLLAIAEAYRARHITTKFSESKYIAMAVVCIFQASFFGAPLFFLADQWPTAQTFVATAVIFIICMAVLLLILVPKLRMMNMIGAIEAAGGEWTSHTLVRRNGLSNNRMSRRSNVIGGTSFMLHGRPSMTNVNPSSFQRRNTNTTTPEVVANEESSPVVVVETNNNNNNANPETNNNNLNRMESRLSNMGLEEDIWNCANVDGLQRVLRLQEELGESRQLIRTLQMEIEALKQQGGSGDGGNEDAA